FVTNPIHESLAPVGPDDSQGGIKPLLSVEADGRRQLRELRGDRRVDGPHRILPDPVARSEGPEMAERLAGGGERVPIGVRGSLVAGQEETALPGLGVLQVGKYGVQLHADLMGKSRVVPGGIDPAEVDEGRDPDEDEQRGDEVAARLEHAGRGPSRAGSRTTDR